MVSMAQMEGCRKLEQEGLTGVNLPHTNNTPIPGMIIFCDEGHTKLEMLQADGTVVNLLAVWQAAEDCVRNWHKDDKSNLPKFVGDFRRLTKLAEALNGRKVV